MAPYSWSFITKKWYFPTKVFLIPQKWSFNHIYLTFSLSNMIYALLSKKCCKSHLRTCMGQIAQDAWIRGWGSTWFRQCLYFGTFWTGNPSLTLQIISCGSLSSIPFYKKLLPWAPQPAPTVHLSQWREDPPSLPRKGRWSFQRSQNCLCKAETVSSKTLNCHNYT